MNNVESKEFFNLISTLANEQTFSTTLTDNETYSFRQLNTFQLKELVKAVVDSPLTQSLFNTTISKIFRDSLVKEDDSKQYSFTILDRLIFVLENRIHSISQFLKQETDNKTTTIDLVEVVEKLRTLINSSSEQLKDSMFTEGTISILYGVPSIDSDERMNKEVYKDIKPDVENTEELRKLLGEAFVNEITKAVKGIQIGDKQINFDSLDFKTRVKMIESLPANLIKKVINFVEFYKELIENSLQISKDVSVTIDGSLFSLR
jgi:hypothetical protein